MSNMNSKTTKSWLARAWTGKGAPRWQTLLLGCVIFGLLFFGIPALVEKANGAQPQTMNQKMCPPDPGPERVCSPDQFITYFKAGAYGYAHTLLPYSKAIHRFFMHAVRHHKATHPKYTPCPGSPNLGCTWHRYVKRDRCAVSSLPNNFDADSCRDSKHLRGLLSSPYWTRRGHLQNKWTAQIVFCGGVLAITIALKGAPPLAMVGGAACVASKAVPSGS